MEMELDDEARAGLGLALNEAALLGVEVDAATRRAAATFSVLTLPEDGPPPEDARVQLVFEPVGRVAASLRLGRWNDPAAPVETFGLDELLPTVQSFGGGPIYGWEFFDVGEARFAALRDRLSLDVSLGMDGRAHSLSLSQEGSDRHLDLWLWFDRLTIRDAAGRVIPLAEFIAGGVRWWDAFHRHDPRTEGRGMFPLA